MDPGGYSIRCEEEEIRGDKRDKERRKKKQALSSCSPHPTHTYLVLRVPCYTPPPLCIDLFPSCHTHVLYADIWI
jgi:hypothetical protein